MQFRPYVGRGKARARLHGSPIAGKRRPLLKLGAEADEFHPRKKHGPDHVGNAIGRRHEHGTAIVKRLLEPIHEAQRFGATFLGEPHDSRGIEGLDAPGKDRGARSS
jgi:hypothetical protein